MLTIGLVLAAVAALIHVYIFVLESLQWTGDAARRTFDIESPQVAEITKPLAYNQGFYNLFLAIEIALGIVLVIADQRAVGLTLVLVGTGSMVAAGLVLMLSDRSKTSAALKQLLPPFLAILAIVVAQLA